MKEKKPRKSMKGYYLTTFLIGLGFFTMGLMDPCTTTYIPIFLGRYIESNAVIGTIMTLDKHVRDLPHSRFSPQSATARGHGSGDACRSSSPSSRSARSPSG